MKNIKTLSNIIISPIITEKAYSLQEKGVYTFKVSWDATKTQIKHAIEKIYGVKVKKVRTLRVPGKRKIIYLRGGRKITGKTPHYKKAYITLLEGKIDLYKGI